MSRRLSTFLASFLIAITCAAAAAGATAATELSAESWDEALALSREHHRPILIDFYTRW